MASRIAWYIVVNAFATTSGVLPVDGLAVLANSIAAAIRATTIVSVASSTGHLLAGPFDSPSIQGGAPFARSSSAAYDRTLPWGGSRAASRGSRWVNEQEAGTAHD